jgi:hypothetical protein
MRQILRNLSCVPDSYWDDKYLGSEFQALDTERRKCCRWHFHNFMENWFDVRMG